MKVQIGRPWAGKLTGLPSWFKYGSRNADKQEELVEVDLTFEMLQELYNTGANIMLLHSRDGKTVLFVDDRAFGQR